MTNFHFWNLKFGTIMVIVSICVFDLFPCPTITLLCIPSHLSVHIFSRMQSVKVHGLAKYEWLLFIEQKWV
jgi:hypothetical protein